MRVLRYREFLNESVIVPSSEIANTIGDIIKSGEWRDLDELNGLLYPHVRIMDVNEFRGSLETDLEKDGVPMNAPLFAAYHTKLKIPVILYNMDEARLLSGIRTPEIVKKIEMMLDHEIVHQEQDIRSGGRAYSLERSPKYDAGKYFSHYSEIMAYARTLARELNNVGFTKEKSIDLIRRGKISHWIWETYKGIGGSVFVGFKKKLVEYLERPHEGIYENVNETPEKIKDVLIKRIPFLKEYNIFESERNPEKLHAQKISYYEGIKRVIGEEIYVFPGYTTASEVFYYPHKIRENTFHYFIIKNTFRISKPQNMDDLMYRVFIMVKKGIEENFSYRKEIMLKEGNEIPYDVLDVIINEMNKNLFEFEEFTEKENVPLF
jgi:hypothetical protein